MVIGSGSAGFLTSLVMDETRIDHVACNCQGNHDDVGKGLEISMPYGVFRDFQCVPYGVNNVTPAAPAAVRSRSSRVANGNPRRRASSRYVESYAERLCVRAKSRISLKAS